MNFERPVCSPRVRWKVLIAYLLWTLSSYKYKTVSSVSVWQLYKQWYYTIVPQRWHFWIHFLAAILEAVQPTSGKQFKKREIYLYNCMTKCSSFEYFFPHSLRFKAPYSHVFLLQTSSKESKSLSLRALFCPCQPQSFSATLSAIEQRPSH